MRNLWDVLPATWQFLLLFALVTLFVLIPSALVLERFFPGITTRKFGPELPVPSRKFERHLELFSACLYGSVILAAFIILAMKGNGKNDPVMTFLVFGVAILAASVAALRHLRQWREMKADSLRPRDSEGVKQDDA